MALAKTTGDIPTITGSTYTTSTTSLGAFGGGLQAAQNNLNIWQGDTTAADDPFRLMKDKADQRRVQKLFFTSVTNNTAQENEVADKTNRRIVQVFIADPDDNVPLEDSVIYTGQQKLTDSTDQELFFEIDIKTILDAHNLKRTKIVNKKVKERTEYLEPTRVRDLKMVVVTVAQF